MGRYKDVPQQDRQLFPMSLDEKIMHASLQINTKTILMGCDSIETYEQPATEFANKFIFISVQITRKKPIVYLMNCLRKGK